MSSLYQTNRFILFFFLATLTLPNVLFAAERDVIPTPPKTTPRPPSTSTLYPTYPPTQAVNGNQAAAIKRGEYLIKMGDCIACHTNTERGGAPFSGGLAMNTPFGTFYTPNITPDHKTGIGTWTEHDFIRSMKEGINAKGHHLFAGFPFVYFSNITNQDARDMYAYLMSIPAVESTNKPMPFPFNIPGARAAFFGWKLLFFYGNDPIRPDQTQSAEWNRGRYIVDGLGHCSMCHTPLNALGSPEKKFYLTGGFIDGYWAPNITRDGLDSATDDEVNRVFVNNELINHAGPVAGPMAEVNHVSLMYLTDDDRFAIITYLKTVTTPDPHSLLPSDKPPTLFRGKQVYRQACVICHQNGETSAPLIGKSSSWFSRLTDNGLAGLYRNAINGYNNMPIKGACVTCSDNDIRAAVDYILNESLSRSQWLDMQPTRLDENAHQVRDEDVN